MKDQAIGKRGRRRRKEEEKEWSEEERVILPGGAGREGGRDGFMAQGYVWCFLLTLLSDGIAVKPGVQRAPNTHTG